MDLTISVDDDLLERSRKLAQRRGISLQEMIRQQLRLLAGPQGGAEAGRELLELMNTHGGRSGGRPWKREDAYEGRV